MRRPTKQRWTYEPVESPPALVARMSSGIECVIGTPGSALPGVLLDGSTVAGETLDMAVGGTGDLSSSVGPRETPGSGAGAPGFPSHPVLPGPPPRERVRLSIRLTFPGGEREDQGYSVHRDLPVRLFQSAMASLIRTDGAVSLYVGPTWHILDHCGTVSDQVFPGTISPCPFLQQGSVVRVVQGGFPARVPRDDPGSFKEKSEEVSSASKIGEHRAAQLEKTAASESQRSDLFLRANHKRRKNV